MARFSAFVERQHVGKWHEKDIFEKPVGNGWILRKIAHAQVEAPPGNGCYWDEHQLVGPRLMQKIACQRWEWAELDGERLVWASEGKLSAHVHATYPLAETPAALKAIADRKVMGKVILKP